MGVAARFMTMLSSAALVGMVASCGGDTTIVKTVTQIPEPTASAEPENSPEPTTAASARAASNAEVGDSLTVDTGETSLKLRVISVLDPLTTGEYDAPESGHRYVGIRLSVTNDGGAAYSDSLGNGAAVVLRGNEQAQSTIVSGGPCGGSFGSDLKLATDDTRVGCIPFEVPLGARLRTFQFTPNSGFGDETAEWDLRSARAVTSTPGQAGQSSTSPQPSGSSGSASSVAFTRCDPNISARVGTTTCGFAGNAFYEYWTSGRAASISVYSPATGRSFQATCSSDGGDVVCETDDGGVVKFSEAALDAYSQSQADKYAASHDVSP